MTLTKEDTKVQKLILNVGTEEDIQAAISAGEIGQNELSIITNKSDCKRNVGEIIESALPLTDAGLHLLDGSLILGGGIYDEFVQYIAGLVSTYPGCFTTEAAWQQSVTNYGVCGKFVYNSVNNTVRLPKITGIVEGTTDPTALGDLVEAGCPNITGSFTNENTAEVGATGAFYRTSGDRRNGRNGNDNYNDWFYFDASRSNPIYGNSDTVQPQTIKALYYIVVAASIKTDIEVDIDNIATDLNEKANKDLSNCTKPYIVETYNNGHDWYRIYSDGWVEQGSWVLLTGSTSPSNTTINLLVAMDGDNYTCVAVSNVGSSGWQYANGATVEGKTSTTFYTRVATGSGTAQFNWYVCGYKA